METICYTCILRRTCYLKSPSISTCPEYVAEKIKPSQFLPALGTIVLSVIAAGLMIIAGLLFKMNNQLGLIAATNISANISLKQKGE